MKVATKAAPERYWKYQPAGDFSNLDLQFFPLSATDDEIIQACPDAQVLCVDAIAQASAHLIAGLPQLRLIQSEGVGYNGVDIQAATDRGIFVCNNAGINAAAVAEQTVLLILGLLRSVLAGHQAVLEGKQIDMKERLMVEGIREVADCSIGIIGLGAIGQATARLLKPFGCKLFYSGRSPKPALEQELGITFLPQDELLRTCDVISLHCAVTPDTTHMVNADFLSAMKPNALLINTGRGELVDNQALVDALEEGTIGGAGLDTIAPEPVLPDNPLINLSPKAQARLLISPHVGGVTTSTFRRGFQTVWGNLARMRDGQRPVNIVNGL